MNRSDLFRRSALAFGAGVALAASSSHAYPVKPIRLIIPNAPGGGTDTIAR